MSIRKTATGRWRADFKNGPDRATRTFTLKRDAVAWESEQRLTAERGSWIPPHLSRVTLDEVFHRWMAARNVSGSTRATDQTIWRAYVEPRFGSRAVNQVLRPEVRAWLTSLRLQDGQLASPRTQKHALRILRSTLQQAVEEGRLATNPAAGLEVRGTARTTGQALSLPEMERLVGQLVGPDRHIALVLALTGLRASELAALNGEDLVEVGGRPYLRVRARWVLGEDGRRLRLEGTKAGRQVERLVPVVTRIQPYLEASARTAAPTSPLFPSRSGGRWAPRTWREQVRWAEACAAIGKPGLRTHDLRHSAATLWLGITGSVKATQAVLGHASAAMTLDVYGHALEGERLQALEAMNVALGADRGAAGC